MATKISKKTADKNKAVRRLKSYDYTTPIYWRLVGRNVYCFYFPDRNFFEWACLRKRRTEPIKEFDDITGNIAMFAGVNIVKGGFEYGVRVTELATLEKNLAEAIDRRVKLVQYPE